ncbi:vitamin K epoxide reductase family protein [Brachybacterium sp. FME24]|uniref:vitamin K epoxide reductase family protein n=1 Tax=Brachybacterium sp. FME24 TaxID=2742605 RepID=UPI001868D3CA|nr:vitamin K epoxide reductase family protein [Brachybacterium sp. FME24]
MSHHASTTGPADADDTDDADYTDDADATDAELIAQIDAELAEERSSTQRAGARLTGAVLLLGGLLGWISALKLLIDKEFLLQNPGASLACDINPFISCGNVMMTWQASALGLPNQAIGLAGYAIMAMVGALMVSGTHLPPWFRWARLGGMTFAFGYIQFLAISAIFVIKALCPWCMVIWTVTAPMFFSTLARSIESGDLRLPAPLASVLRHWVVLSVAWYVVVIIVILAAFWGQWLTMLGIA